MPAHTGLLRSPGLVAAMSCCALIAFSQNYTINRYALSGGGGVSAGGLYSVSGTLGQTAAGKTSGASYSLSTGFWGLVRTVQPPGAPRLSLFLTRTNTVMLSWPSASQSFILQENTDGATWLNVTQLPVDDGANTSVILNPPVGNALFRLKKTVGGSPISE